jgi:IS5 family transposase
MKHQQSFTDAEYAQRKRRGAVGKVSGRDGRAIIEALSSVENCAKSREPEMKPVRKCNQRYFGMKARIGVDTDTGMARGVEVTGANVHDLEAVPKLVRPDDDAVSGDAYILA